MASCKGIAALPPAAVPVGRGRPWAPSGGHCCPGVADRRACRDWPPAKIAANEGHEDGPHRRGFAAGGQVSLLTLHGSVKCGRDRWSRDWGKLAMSRGIDQDLLLGRVRRQRPGSAVLDSRASKTSSNLTKRLGLDRVAPLRSHRFGSNFVPVNGSAACRAWTLDFANGVEMLVSRRVRPSG